LLVDHQLRLRGEQGAAGGALSGEEAGDELGRLLADGRNVRSVAHEGPLVDDGWREAQDGLAGLQGLREEEASGGFPYEQRIGGQPDRGHGLLAPEKGAHGLGNVPLRRRHARRHHEANHPRRLLRLLDELRHRFLGPMDDPDADRPRIDQTERGELVLDRGREGDPRGVDVVEKPRLGRVLHHAEHEHLVRGGLTGRLRGKGTEGHEERTLALEGADDALRLVAVAAKVVLGDGVAGKAALEGLDGGTPGRGVRALEHSYLGGAARGRPEEEAQGKGGHRPWSPLPGAHSLSSWARTRLRSSRITRRPSSLATPRMVSPP